MKYEKEHSEYAHHKDSQTVVLMLKRLSNLPKIPQEFRSQPILRLLIDSAQELMLDLFEIAVFGIYLDRFGWQDSSFSAHFLLMYVGYAAKKYMGSYINHIHEYIKRKISNFDENFEVWETKNFNFLEISIIDLNDWYSRLKNEGFDNIINYNFYVDEILQISPPYQIEQKENLASVNRLNKENNSTAEENFEITQGYKNSGKKTENSGKMTGFTGFYNKIEAVCTNYLSANKDSQVVFELPAVKKTKNVYLVALSNS